MTLVAGQIAIMIINKMIMKEMRQIIKMHLLFLQRIIVELIKQN